MRILFSQHNEIKVVNLPNFGYLPLFYFYPKELLESKCPSLVDMPRSVHGILTQEKWFKQLASDFFLQAVIDLTAFFVWPAFRITTYMECFSVYDPLWRLAHAVPIWEKAFEHMSGITPKSLAATPKREQPWIGMDEFKGVMIEIGLLGITENNLLPCIKTVREMRCAEDYDYRNSNAKIDFYRSWYHTRSKTISVSLDHIIEVDGNDSRDDSISDQLGNFVCDPVAQYEDLVCSKLDIVKFYQSIKPLDREILELRIQGYTYQEIAEKTKYITHSAVLKRINRIAAKYLDYKDEQEGFRDFLVD